MGVLRRSCPDVSLLAGRGCVPGVLRVSIRRHAARSWLHLHLLCAPRSAPGAGCGPCAFAPEPVLVALGMVSHLLRVRRGENCQSRLFLASSHGNGRLLPERPFAYLDRMVRAA